MSGRDLQIMPKDLANSHNRNQILSVGKSPAFILQ